MTLREAHDDAIRHLPEQEFMRDVVAVAKVCGWWTYHTWTSIHSEPGFPDLVLLRPPRLILAELKTERGRVSVPQSRCLAMFREVPGLEVYLWRPSDMDAVVEILQRCG